MIPLLTAAQIREADAYTIAHEPIASIDLMERASSAFVDCFVERYQDQNKTIAVYCGTGNNGGDGLAIARMLGNYFYKSLTVKIARFSSKATDDFNANLEKITNEDIPVTEIKPGEQPPHEDADIIIDALLGSGLNKLLEGDYKTLVEFLNSLQKTVVAVDVPTGFFTDGEVLPDATVLKAEMVITFQQPKINFLLPESGPYIKGFEVVDIGIDEKFTQSLNSPYQFVEEKDIRQMLQPRQRFSNKGTYGHALILAGQPETMGAALLSTSACVYAGAGLTTACIPQSGLIALNTYMPEIMALMVSPWDYPPTDWSKYSAIGAGPGLGQNENSLLMLKNILESYEKPMVIDADALNLLASNQELLGKLPKNSILTPHMKEFDRLFGEHQNWWQRIQTGIEKAKELQICILLKNDYTLIITPAGNVCFNSTSNAAMATGGMGDVLTGIITSLLAQKYTSEDACIIGAYIHGQAGDELALSQMNMVLPSQIAARLPYTMANLMA